MPILCYEGNKARKYLLSVVLLFVHYSLHARVLYEVYAIALAQTAFLIAM